MGRHGVAIAGGGPTGMMLAAELTLAGIDTVVVERRDSPALAGSRAGGLHARTIEILDQRGVAGRFLAEGRAMQVAGFDQTRFDIGGFPSRHPYGLALWQSHIERIMAGWIGELGVRVLRGRDVTGFSQDAGGVMVALSDGSSLAARYLVGCDGGRSVVRKAAGIGFPGWEPTLSNLIAEVELAEEPEWGVRRDAIGTHGLSRLETGPVRVMVTERELRTGDATLDDLRRGLVAVYGTDFGAHSPTWISRFTDAARQADAYRRDRVLLAGDAAHIHYPAGGQGLNIGVQDAVNLGWKLALVVKGLAPERLLDTYHQERHPVAARVLKLTLAQVALRRTDARTAALGEVVADLLALDAPNTRYAAIMSGLDIRYELGDGHPLLGRRMPDLDLVTREGPMRVYDLLHQARPVLLDLGQGVDIAPWADRVPVVVAACGGAWELPVVGAVAPPPAVLVRPDGYVAWAGEGGADGLAAALETWFGPARLR